MLKKWVLDGTPQLRPGEPSTKKKAPFCQQVADKHQFLTKVDWKTWQFTQWNKDIEHDFSFLFLWQKKYTEHLHFEKLVSSFLNANLKIECYLCDEILWSRWQW